MTKATFGFELKNRLRKDKRQHLYLRITKERKMKRMATGIYVFKVDFNKDAKFGCWIRNSDPQSMLKNNTMKELLMKAEMSLGTLEKHFVQPSLENIGSFLKGENYKEDYFSYMSSIRQECIDTERVNMSRDLKVVLMKLKEYRKNDKLPFEEVNYAFLAGYEVFCKKRGNGVNTIHKEFKCIRAVLYRAIKEDLFPQEKNPFFKFKLKGEKTNRTKLSETDIQKLADLELKTGTRLFDSRNLFLFSFYCAGIRFGDVISLQWKNVRDGRLMYQMNKTGTHKSILLHPKAAAILDLYRKPMLDKDNLIFPFLSPLSFYKDEFDLFRDIGSKNAIVNSYLKDLAVLAEIDQRLSFHISRHSFADLARRKKVGLYDISKALGHSSVKITEVYLNSLDQESVDEALEKVFL